MRKTNTGETGIYYRDSRKHFLISFTPRGMKRIYKTCKTLADAITIRENLKEEYGDAIPSIVLDGLRPIRSLGKTYSASEDGKIYSHITDRFMTPSSSMIRDDGSSYDVVCITKPCGNQSTMYVHRLVAEAFIPNPKIKPTINHKNGNKKDNMASNLEWATHSENIYHALDTGLRSKKNKFLGVRMKPSGRFSSIFNIKGKTVTLGTFDTEIAAAIAHDEYIEKHKLGRTLNFKQVEVA